MADWNISLMTALGRGWSLPVDSEAAIECRSARGSDKIPSEKCFQLMEENSHSKKEVVVSLNA